MKTALKTRWLMSLAMVMAGAFAGVGRSAAAGSPETTSIITIHVHNYAGVDEKTLAEAEKVMTEIFRKAGVEIRWVDNDLTSQNKLENPIDQESSHLFNIWVNFYPRLMAERFRLSSDVMGFAPGTQRNRDVVYVFYNRLEVVYQKQMNARSEGILDRIATMPQLLAHAISHEIGHVLLNIESHSETGIMRGNWDLNDLRDLAYGYLLFTKEQAPIIRAEVVRRARQQQTADVAGLESPTLAR